MLNKNIKKIIALGMSLSTVTGTMPAVISPIPVFANEVENETSFNDAKVKLDDELNKVEFSSATNQEDIDSILKDFSYTTTTGTAVTVQATTKSDSFSNEKDTCSFTVGLSDGNVSKFFDYSYPYEKAAPLKTNLLTSSDGAEENQYGTVLTITTDYWAPIVIAGVTLYPWNDTDQINDPYLVVDQLNAAKASNSFTGGYKLISAEVTDFTDSVGNPYQKVVVKLGLTEKLSTFPLDIATLNGKPLQKDSWGNIYNNSGAMTAKMDTYDIVNKSVLETLYNAHKDDIQGKYTDASWRIFTTALSNAKTVIDNTAATQDEIITAKTNLENAMNGLEKGNETIITITTDFWAPIVIAGVTLYPWNDTDQINDPDLVVTQLNAAKTSDSFTGGYKLISAEVKEFEDSDGNVYQKVVVKLGLAEKLSTFPLDVATLNGKPLQKDSWGNIYNNSGAMTAKMDTYDIVNKSVLETLYNAHKDDIQGKYTDASWRIFTTALSNAKTVIDNTAATQDEIITAKTNLETAMNGLEKGNETIITITTDFWAPIVIAGVTLYPWNDTDQINDPDLVVTQLNAAKTSDSFTGGYKLISAEVKEFEDSDGNVYQKVVVKLGLAEKLSTFPLDVATLNGKPLQKDSWGNIYNNSGAMTAKMDTYDIVNKSVLETLYNAHKDDIQGKYTDESWRIFTTALSNAKTVIDNKAATQDEIITAKTNLENAMNGLEKGNETIITITTDFWAPIVIAGVTLYPWNNTDQINDAFLVVDQLNAAKESNSFTGGYKLISAEVKDVEDSEGNPYQKVIVKLGLAEKLSTFPLDVATLNGKPLQKDSWGNIYNNSGAMTAKMDTYDIVNKSVLETLYNAHKDDIQGKYTDESWRIFTTALSNAKTVIDNKAATQDEIITAKTNLENAIKGLENQYGTVVTITTDFWAPIVIAGVTLYPWNNTDQINDPNLVVTQLNAAEANDSFTRGYKLISAEVKDFEDSDGNAYQKVVVKLGLAEKLSTFPLDIATFDGQALQTDEWGNIYGESWAITAKMDTYDIADKRELETLYNGHKDDTKGNNSDENWSAFTTALSNAKTVIDDTTAKQDAITTAKTNLETAIMWLND